MPAFHVEHRHEPIAWFMTEFKAGRLDLEPEIQRRSVWKPKKRMLLIDTIARQLPIGVITLYQSAIKGGVKFYDVIDGKQRLEAVLDFMDARGDEGNELVIDPVKIASDTSISEDVSVNLSYAKQVRDKKWEEVSKPAQERFKTFRIAVTIIAGNEVVAVETFTRMNAEAYALTAQEIRNAVFKDSSFLREVQILCEEFTEHCNKEVQEGEEAELSGFYALRAVTKSGLGRMDDYQMASELLLLQLEGSQPRRDTLSAAYRTYSAPNKANKRKSARRAVQKSLERVWQITGQEPVQAINCMKQRDEFLYALVGAFAKHRISVANFDAALIEIRKVLKEFMDQVSRYLVKDSDKGKFSQLVARYGESSTGQRNSKDNRDTRIGILAGLLAEVVPGVAKESFSAETRILIWLNSKDKKCRRCKEVVSWDDFDAGHIKARANGGNAKVANGHVEHSKCNKGAGAS